MSQKGDWKWKRRGIRPVEGGGMQPPSNGEGKSQEGEVPKVASGMRRKSGGIREELPEGVVERKGSAKETGVDQRSLGPDGDGGG
jgi:hypothetical protein